MLCMEKGGTQTKIFLTSSPIGIYRSEEPLDYKGFNPANGMVDALKEFWTENARCLLISAFPDEYEIDDRMRDDYENIVKDTGLSISCMDICDLRNGREKAEELHSYDFVILGGGHVPTQSAFFKSIGLAESFIGFDGIVMGISAGTMNCARIVYAEPEMPGEATDPDYERFIPGLGLTEYNMIPHYNAVKNDVIDGMRLIEDIAFGDSFGHTFYAITDGSYLLQTEDRAEIRGEAYRISDGKMEQICTDGNVFILHPGNAAEYGFDRIELLDGNPLEGCNICVLGSSVVKGAASGDAAIAEYLGARLGCEYTKSAVNGTTLADVMPGSYIERLKKLDPGSAYDLFICQLSTNDATQNMPLGEISEKEMFDTHTVTGAIEYIITYVRDTWGCPVVFFTGSHYDSERYDAMVIRLKELQAKYDIGVIDLWTDEMFNQISGEARALYMNDGIHPTRAGYRDWWGPEFEKQLLPVYTQESYQGRNQERTDA